MRYSALPAFLTSPAALYTLRKCSTRRTNVRGNSAYTLVEIMVALCMLSLLTAALFALINAQMIGINESAIHIRRDQQFEACIQLLRESFRKLPPVSVIKTLTEQELKPLRLTFHPSAPEFLKTENLYNAPVLVTGQPQLFSWQAAQGTAFTSPSGANPAGPGNAPSEQATALISQAPYYVFLAQRHTDGILTLSVLCRGWNEPIPLIENLTDIQWRFLNDKTAKWTDTWINGARPSLVELTLTLAETPARPVRCLFWMPAVQPQL
jgi:type II secretory pathway component PulJ